MRHLVSGRKLGRTWSHRRALMSNMATSLIISDSKSITTTLAKAKELRPYIEKLITRAKIAFVRERNGEFASGHVDVHARREVGKVIKDKKALQALFDEIAPAVLERPGGYTRVIKLGQRRGDGAEEAIIQLVDWSAKQDGVISLNDKKRKPAAKRTAAKASPKSSAQPAEEAVAAPAVVATVAAEPEAVATDVDDAVPATESAVFEDTSSTEAPTAGEVEGGSDGSDTGAADSSDASAE
ncbi:MAG: 50S ribosomal protein L17 [Candidatus Kapaibacterium sp.]